MKLVRIQYPSEEKLSVKNLGLPPYLVETFEELGVISIREGLVAAEEIRRLFKILRLKNCLGVDLASGAIIMDLLDRIETLEEEIRRLQKSR